MKHGFSLIELSIVLVILGLLTGGIFAGQSLVNAAKMRSQLKDFSDVASAHHAFRDKYACIPGDCRDVASYFPTIANGNGDGRVDCWPASGTNECATYMQSLESAGVLAVRRSATLTGDEYRAGKVENSVSYVHYQDRYAGGGYSPATLLGSGAAWINFVSFNSPWANGPALTPQEAWNFDGKVDDGKPYTGSYMAAGGAIPAGTYRTDCADNTTLDYTLSTSDPACRLFVKIE